MGPGMHNVLASSEPSSDSVTRAVKDFRWLYSLLLAVQHTGQKAVKIREPRRPLTFKAPRAWLSCLSSVSAVCRATCDEAESPAANRVTSSGLADNSLRIVWFCLALAICPFIAANCDLDQSQAFIDIHRLGTSDLIRFSESLSRQRQSLPNTAPAAVNSHRCSAKQLP